MALALNTSGGVTGAGAGPFTVSLSPSGTNRVLFAGIGYYHSTSTLTSVSFNGVAMTAVPSGSYDPGGDLHIRWYYLIAPDTGAHDFSYSFSGGGVYDSGVALTVWTDCDQTTPYGTPVGAAATSTTPSVDVTSAADEYVVDTLIIFHSGTLTVGGSQTEIANAVCPGAYVKHAGSYEVGAATTTMSWANSASQFWATMGVPVKPAAAAATGQPFTKRLAGVPWMTPTRFSGVW